MRERWSDAEVDALLRWGARAMAAAADRKIYQAAKVLATVTEQYGPAGVYSLCMCFAEVIHNHATAGMPAEARAAGARVVVLTDHKDPSSPEARAPLWAARFVAAYANDDQDTSTALFTEPLKAGNAAEYRRNVGALLAMAAAMVRAASATGGGVA